MANVCKTHEGISRLWINQLVYNPDTGEVHSLSPAIRELLGRADGTRTTEEMVSSYPEEVRADAERAISAIAEADLFEPPVERSTP